MIESRYPSGSVLVPIWVLMELVDSGPNMEDAREILRAIVQEEAEERANPSPRSS